ncbi:MAG: tRNA uridine-5-carboxymethylaminomethyl(34) synthesis GTPase MnmE, partial [Sphingomonas bacterium]|nr:tRNA uridine-5-carboxymethylaminomethyl(34) synthesis GTPase MnmE [Sphingomonas bacterium]
MDTIFAVSSGAPPSAIAIIRISGPMAFTASEALAGPVPKARNASLRVLRDAAGVLLDRALVLAFPGPNSATGEDIVELHVHGGRAVIRAVEAALAVQPGLRAAEPGEFTRRALLSGRIDLTEAEGLGDLLSAETETQRRAAVMLAEGGLRRRAEGWTDRVVSLAAM